MLMLPARRRASGSSVSWASVFGGGEVGFVGEFGTANTTLYEEITGASATTVANTDSQLVGTIKCNITNQYFVAPSTGVRATLDITGGLWSLVPTTGTYYDCSLTITGAEIYGAAVINTLATSGADERVISCGASGAADFNNNARILLLARQGTADVWQSYRFTPQGMANVAVADDTIVLLEADCTAIESRIWANGSAGTPESFSSLGNFNISLVRLGALVSTGANVTDSPIYSFCLINRLLTAPEQAFVRTTLGARGGLSL